METAFILGRNPELSRQEVFSFLKARDRKFKEVLFEDNILMIETPEDEKFDIQEFGGILKLGKIKFKGNEKEFIEFLKEDQLIEEDKFTYAIFGNLDAEILKDKFKEEKRKAILKQGRRQLKVQEGTRLSLPKADIFFFIHEYKNKIYFGTLAQNFNTIEVEKRDMDKPVRREHLAISPRLAKILINLSEAKPGKLLLDPFCGIGGILQEAFLKNIKCHGIDNDAQAIKDAKENLLWLKKSYNIDTKYQLDILNSKKAPDLQFAAIATETPLGKVLTKKPNDNQAKQIIQNFEALIIPILSRLKKIKKPEAKIAITFPSIRKFRVNVEKIANKTGLFIHKGPIAEFRPKQFISRDIIVFE